MNNLLHTIKNLKQDVWLILFFLFLARLSLFVSMPYLAFYLSHLRFNPITTGLIIASQPLAYSFCSLISGYFSDKYGKKKSMIISFLATAIISCFFNYATSIIDFLICNILYGGVRSLFDAAMPAYFTDIVKKEFHRVAFNIRFMIINLAASIGPLIGVYFANKHSLIIFDLSAIVYGLSALLMFFFLKKDQNLPAIKDQPAFNIKNTFQTMLRDKALGFLVLGTFIFWICYIQLEAPLAQALLARNPHTATHLFGLMWVVNGVIIVCLQLPLADITKNISLKILTFMGMVLICIAFVGLALSTNLQIFILCVVLITFGEMLVSPLSNIIVAKLAPEHLRSTYFGAISLSSIGIGLGPMYGGFILQYFRPEILFLSVAGLSLLVIICYRASIASENL